MSDIVELELPTSAKGYLTHVLQAEGGLCALMEEAVRLQGRFFAIVPAGTSVARAEQFDTGGLVSTTAAEDQIISRSLGSPGLLVIQDLWANTKDYEDHAIALNLWIYQGKVYLWAGLGSAHTDQIRSLLRHPISWRYAGFLVEDPTVAQKLLAGSASLEDLASHVTEIYVPAYDGESFVIWSR